MKLRILDDSIRLRLDRSEVAQIARGEAVARQTRFPGGTALGYRLETVSGDAEAAFGGDTVVLRLPIEAVRAWAADDGSISLREALPLEGGTLALLVEKDFECIAPRPGESQANRYPNPKRRS